MNRGYNGGMKHNIERHNVVIDKQQYVATIDRETSHPQQVGRLIALERGNEVVWYHTGVVKK
jgi:hypothetical protein